MTEPANVSMQIRPYRDADEPGVIALWALAFPDEPPWNDAKSLIERKLTTQPELFFVCETNGEVIGTAIAGFDGVRGWVHKVAAHPNHRRAGIARRLMATAEAALVARGCSKLNLQVRDGNQQALAFYQQLGYVVEDRVSLGKHLA